MLDSSGGDIVITRGRITWSNMALNSGSDAEAINET